MLPANFHDLVIVGGGPAGLSLATAIRSSPQLSHLKVALIEAGDLGKIRQWQLPPDQFSNRTSSLTPSSMSFLSKMGVKLDSQRVQAYSRMRVWDGLSDSGRISFDASTPIAYMAENANISRALMARLDSLGDVSIFDQTKVSSIDLGTAPDDAHCLDLSLHPHITLSSGQTLVSRLLVGADGFNGSVRRFAGIGSQGWDYERHAVVATLKYDSQFRALDEAVAFQRFLSTGPIALLRLPGGYATLVWTTTPERAASLKELHKDDFIAMVNAAFRLSMVDIDYMSTQQSGQADELAWRSKIVQTGQAEEIGDIPVPVIDVQSGSIASFPLRLRQASTYKSHRIALVGDAAHTIHPLAGQGLNMGLSDSQALASVIENAVLHGADIGDELTCLDKYDEAIWMQNNRMLGAVDKLHWLYSAQFAPIVGVRALGLGLVNRMNGLKSWFMKQAGAA